MSTCGVLALMLNYCNKHGCTVVQDKESNNKWSRDIETLRVLSPSQSRSRPTRHTNGLCNMPPGKRAREGGRERELYYGELCRWMSLHETCGSETQQRERERERERERGNRRGRGAGRWSFAVGSLTDRRVR